MRSKKKVDHGDTKKVEYSYHINHFNTGNNGFLLFIAPRVNPTPQPKPEPVTEETKYEYYILIDEETGNILGYISSVKVSTGDEYISSDNKRYVVIKLEQNRAYMRDFGPKQIR